MVKKKVVVAPESTVVEDVEEAKVSLPVEEPTEIQPQVAPKVGEKLKVISTKIYMVNPFQKENNVFFPNEIVETVYDNWLECQIDKGRLTICK